MAYRIGQQVDIAAPASFVWSIIQEPTLRHRWDARVKYALRISAAGSWHFDEHLPGITTWTTRFSLRSALPLVGAWLEQWLGRYTAALTRTSQQNLKRLAEAEWAAYRAAARAAARPRTFAVATDAER